MSSVAWVTGAAGGIGGAVCRRLRSDGFTVVGIDQAESTDADLALRCDLADPVATRDAARQALEAGEVGAVVHVAAAQPLGGAGELDPQDWARVLQVNLVSLDQLVGVAADSLRSAAGSVVAVSSVHASATTAGIVGYATSKAALQGWVRAAAADLAPRVRVNGVAPGAIDTPMLAEGFARWGASADERRSELERRTPLGRIGTPADVADAVAFLTGTQSSFVTGTVLTVDGGALIRLGTE